MSNLASLLHHALKLSRRFVADRGVRDIQNATSLTVQRRYDNPVTVLHESSFGDRYIPRPYKLLEPCQRNLGIAAVDLQSHAVLLLRVM